MAYKIAVASSDGKNVDLHLGSSPFLKVYTAQGLSFQFLEDRKVDVSSDSAESVEVINVKVDKDQIETLLARDGIYPAFHMNKKCWVSIIFDGTLTDSNIQRMVDESYKSL